MTKTCSHCKQILDVELFNWKYKNKGVRSYHCKECSREYLKKHYASNKDYYIKKAKKWNNIRGEEILDLLKDYFSNNSCIDCGESNWIVLEFDHKDRENKFMEVSLMCSGRYSIDKIKKEIQKCEVRCANCHRRVTNHRRLAQWPE